MDKLIDDIIELILGDVGCHHEVDHDEDGTHLSVEYNLNNETKLRGMIRELIQKPGVTKEWIEEMAVDIANDYGDVAFPNLITIVKRIIAEAGVEIQCE